MTDILKTETEAIVNLAEHLTNLSSRVSELSSPIFQLHEEIKVSPFNSLLLPLSIVILDPL